MSLLPFDLTEVIEQELLGQRREPDGLLHASSHLVGSVRHAQLDVAGAPKAPDKLMSSIRMMTGTLWHKWLAEVLHNLGMEIMTEVNLTPWLPEGWGGTADLVVWNPELRGFVLNDLKTTKGESMRYVRDGAKEEHVWQTSCYWHALRRSGLAMVKKVGVYYLPMNDVRGGGVEPLMLDFDPLPEDVLDIEMSARHTLARRYVESIDPDGPGNPGRFLTDKLEPVQEPLQKIRFDRKLGVQGLWLEPHWTSMFCAYPDELCDCSTQEKVQIGLFDGNDEYHPRPGFEDIEPTVFPG